MLIAKRNAMVGGIPIFNDSLRLVAMSEINNTVEILPPFRFPADRKNIWWRGKCRWDTSTGQAFMGFWNTQTYNIYRFAVYQNLLLFQDSIRNGITLGVSITHREPTVWRGGYKDGYAFIQNEDTSLRRQSTIGSPVLKTFEKDQWPIFLGSEAKGFSMYWAEMYNGDVLMNRYYACKIGKDVGMWDEMNRTFIKSLYKCAIIDDSAVSASGGGVSRCSRFFSCSYARSRRSRKAHSRLLWKEAA